MKSDIQHVFGFALGLFVLSISTSFAQVAPPPEIKTGDRLTYSWVRFNGGERSIVERPPIQEVAAITIDSATEDRIYAYTNDSNLVRKNKLFGTLLFRNTAEVLKNKPQNVLQGKPVIGQTWEYESSQTRANETRSSCSVIDRKNKASVFDGPDVTLQVKGVAVTVKTLLIMQDSVWYNGSCGNGTDKAKYLYSPALNELVLEETVRYYQENRVDSGGRRMLLSVD